MCVVGKNYRLQDIQLSKTRNFCYGVRRERCRSTDLPILRPATIRVQAGPFVVKLPAASFPLPADLSAASRRASLNPYPAFRARWKLATGSRKLMVENTGLEPVTSWLQTRRSPS